MIASIELQFSCQILQLREFDGEREVFSAIQHGELIVADSWDLLIEALAQGHTQLQHAA